MTEHINLTWNNIEISIEYKRDYLGADLNLSHIAVLASEPLPFTNTWYISIFISEERIAKYGGVRKLILAWLEKYSKQEERRAYLLKKAQPPLFCLE